MELINLSHKNKKLFNIGQIGAANTSYTTETDDDAHHAKVDYRRITSTIMPQTYCLKNTAIVPLFSSTPDGWHRDLPFAQECAQASLLGLWQYGID